VTVPPETTPDTVADRRGIVGRVAPPVAALVVLLGMATLNTIAPGPLLIPWPWSAVGFGLLIAGLALGSWASLTFMRAGASSRLFHGNPEIVAHGPFRRTRNPMYLSLVVTVSGVALLTSHLSPWLGPVALFLWYDRLFVPREEAVLAAHFGAGWDTYCARVRRWV